jgi:predicted glutamine amidotransferase
MCELFGLSSKQPTTVQISLAEFARRGGATGPHIDGWGIAFFRDGDVLLIREPEPSAHSAHLRFIHDQHVPSPLVISHIRRATQGSVCLRNTQPFTRELGGRPHIFAHNGDLGTVCTRRDFAGTHFRVIGDTDSEYAFCYLLSLLQPLWQGDTPPDLEQRLKVFGQFCATMVEFGEANFVYSDGDYLFAHSHRRRQDNGEMCPPGLHLLERDRHEHEHLAGVDVESEQAAVLLASAPLSSEGWQPLPEHTIVVIAAGRVVTRRHLYDI